jgi:hypothetical protein
MNTSKLIGGIGLILFICAFAAGAYTPVEKHGALSVEGTKVIDEHGDVVTLHGMCLFWSQWCDDDEWYNAGVIETLAKDWKISVLRAAISPEGRRNHYTDPPGTACCGYLDAPEVEYAKLTRVVEACVDQGMYVIIDWHSYYAGDYPDESAEFFSRAAEDFGHYPNVLYELWNEPYGFETYGDPIVYPWDPVIKDYSNQMIAAIREKDPDNIILVNTQEWDLRPCRAAENPVDNTYNTVIAWHSYLTSGLEQWLQNEVDCAIENGFALINTEWSIAHWNGTETYFPEAGEELIQFCKDRDISWMAWCVNNKDENLSAIVPSGSPYGGWSEEDYTYTGNWFRDHIREINSEYYNDNDDVVTLPRDGISASDLKAHLSTSQNKAVRVFDLQGKLVSQSRTRGNIRPGVYIYTKQAGAANEYKTTILDK